MAQHRFQKGNQFAKGDPLAGKLFEFRKTIQSAVSKKNVRDIMKAMIAKAIKGDVKAATLVLERVAGKVKDNTEISVSNGQTQELTIKLKTEENVDAGSRTENQ